MASVESRADRRRERTPHVVELFGASAEAALDLLESTDFAWQDCYGDSSAPSQVMSDIYVCSEGRLDQLARAACLAVIDSRDLRSWAETLGGQRAATRVTPVGAVSSNGRGLTISLRCARHGDTLGVSVTTAPKEDQLGSGRCCATAI